MKRSPTPTIMITGADKGEHEDIYFEALRLGAFDIISKPQGGDALNLGKMASILEERIRFAARITPRTIVEKNEIIRPKTIQNVKVIDEKKIRISNKLNKLTDRLLIIGASAGGPKAIFQVLSNLQYFPGLTICVIQHMPEEFTKSFALRIDDAAKYRAKEAENGELLRTGLIYVAPGNRHMELSWTEEGLIIDINQKPRIHGCRPSVDVFMNSVLKSFDPQRIIGVLLTGMGDDGAAGLLLIREKGGITISQDKETSEIWGMPKKAVELGAVQHVLPLTEISGKLNLILNG
jgi:two-component system chemotaxis response regulator CheB